jgi:uncharacterized protein YfaS (alpha-2-macroglobulin family)
MHAAKNWTIALLLLVVAGQAWLLKDRYLTARSDGMAVTAVSLDSQMRTVVSMEFDRPVPEAARALPAPATIAPLVAGQWVWSNPYTLKFLAQTPLPLDMQYDLALDEAMIRAGLRGDSRFVLKTGAFAITDADLTELASDAGPDMVELTGRIVFNGPVAPEKLLPLMSLTEANGTAVELSLQTQWRSTSFQFRSQPIRKDTQGRTLTLAVAPTLPMEGKTLTLGTPFRKDVQIRLDPELRLENLTPNADMDATRISLEFSAPVSASAIREHLEVRPEAGIQISTHGKTATLSGAFVPGATYTLRLSPGLTAEDGAVLAAAREEAARIPDLPPGVDFSARGMFLPRQGDGRLGMFTVNTESVELTVSRIFPNNLSALFQDYGYAVFEQDFAGDSVPYHLGSEVFRATYSVASKPNAKTERTMSMSELIPDNRPGLYKLSLNLPSEYRGATRWVLRTDIGLVAKAEGAGYLVWATSINTLAALPGVTVTLVSAKNQILGQARTDERGLARIPYQTEEDEVGAPAMVQATLGEDFSFLFLERFRVDTTGLDVSGASVGAAGLQAYVYGKRDIYRPGETLDGTVLVRDANLNTPAAMPLILTQRDPQGRVLRTLNLALADGLATFSLDIPDWSLTGQYSLEVGSGEQTIGSYAYQVEEFIPDRIGVEIGGVPDQAGPGQTLSFDVASRYLFGPPAANLAVTAKVRLVSAGFAPKGFEGYAFGDPERTFEPVPLLSTDSRLDNDGQASFALDIPQGLTPPLALEAEITSRVREQGGRGVTARRRVPVHTYPLYPGIRRPASQELEPRKPAVFDFVTVSPAGNATAHPELVATLFQDQWQTVMRKTENGFRYESVRNPVRVSTQTIAAGTGAAGTSAAGTSAAGVGTGSFTITPPDYGSYRVRLHDPAGGAASELEFYCGGWGYSPWAVQNPARLDLIPDKAGYRAGETASIQIRSPFAGKALVTVEGLGVDHLQTVDIPGNTAQIHIPVREEWQPNRHLTATLVRRGADIQPGSPGRAFGAIPLFVDSLSNKMDVRVRVPEQVRPETDLTLAVETAPLARVTVAVVDEGIMQLAGGANPDPFGHFYAKRALDVTSYDNFALLFPHLALGTPLAGGDEAMGGASSFMRTEGIRRVKPVTFWSGVLTADATGQLTHTVHLPEFQGALRVVAVGHKDKSFGTGTALTRVRTPLVLTPTLPRFLGLGDTVQIPLTLRNDTAAPGTFQLNATVSGPAALTSLPEPVELLPGTTKTVYATLRCGDVEGAVNVAFTARGNNETVTAREDLDQRSALPPIRIQESGVLKDASGPVSAAVPDTLTPGTITRTVRLSTQPLTRFSGHLENLLAYPYGCAEQTVSKAFPLLYFGALARELAPGRFSTAGPAGLVQMAIRRLQTMQTPTGGYGYWPGADEPDPWVSAYVCHFLLEARTAGHTVPMRMLQDGLGYLRTLAGLEPGSPALKVEQAAYAQYVLALGGQADLGSQDFLRATFGPNLNGVTKTLLAGAYFASGNQNEGFALLHATPAFDDDRRDTGGNLGSGLRDRAMAALVLQHGLPDDPRLPEILARIGTDLGRDAWYSTQETSLAFMALGKYLSTLNDDRPFAGTLSWNGGEKAFAETKALVEAGIPTLGAISLTKTPVDRDVFFTVVTTGTPRADTHASRADGLEVEQALLARDGQPLALDQIRQGDLVLLRTRVRSTTGRVDNVVVQSLLPAGLEVENPRLATTEKLDWMDETDFMDGHQDLRDDRILVFTNLSDNGWRVRYSLLRAVTPGTFALPPVQAEAMYHPGLRASGGLGSIQILPDEQVP